MSQDIYHIHLHWMSLSRGVETPLLTLNRHVPEARPHAAAGAGAPGLEEVQPGNLLEGDLALSPPNPLWPGNSMAGSGSHRRVSLHVHRSLYQDLDSSPMCNSERRTQLGNMCRDLLRPSRPRHGP